MKDYITNFDLEAAFKALDEIDIPNVDGVKANKAPLTEIFDAKSKLEYLVEEYYDINDGEELGAAKADLEADIAAAKLARIEKIVDLDAKSPEDLQPSYVGKYIIQCPQCMTLFYKDKEDVVESEDDSAVVNVNETCQHCGNESGYTLVGKVGAAEESEEELPVEDDTEDTSEEADEVELEPEEFSDELSEEPIDDEDFDLGIELEDDEAEQTEESFTNYLVSNTSLNEALQEDSGSSDDFDKLLATAEFKEPISDTEIRGILSELDESANSNNLVEASYGVIDDYRAVAECLIDATMYSGKFLQARWVKNQPTVKELSKHTYKVTHHKGGASVIVKFSIEDEDEMMLNFTINGEHYSTPDSSKAQDFILAELDKAYVSQFNVPIDEDTLKKKTINKDTLAEGILDKINKHKAKRNFKKRQEKADFILKSALVDYDKLELDNNGEIVASDNNKRFKTFVVLGFKENYSDGAPITVAPTFNTPDLELGREPVLAKNYEQADNFAKGWSSKQGNGPSFIMLAKNEDDPEAAYLCQYFKGKLVYDQLDKYFEFVQKDIDSSKLMNDGLKGPKGKNKQTDDTPEDTSTEETENDTE